MKKIMNKAEDYVDDMLKGIYAAHPHDVTYVNNDLRCFVSKTTAGKKGKVGVMSGGGSGHLPLFLGFVGEGILDGAAIGGVFQSPSGKQIYEITKAINNGAGVLYIYGNYNGDILNFEMSTEMAEMDDIETLHSVVAEDVLSSPKGAENKRRGVAGMFLAFKLAGAAAEKMMPLQEVKRIADKTCANMRTVGMALSPCIVPELGRPSFNLAADEMEIGMGVHGEPGTSRTKMTNADAIVDQMLNPILEDLPYKAGDEVAVLMNSLGATPMDELYIMYRRVAETLKEKEISVYHVYVGEFATSMEMAGSSITLLKLDSELKSLLAAPANSTSFVQMQLG